MNTARDSRKDTQPQIATVDGARYSTFTRSCRNFAEMAAAKRRTVERNLTYAEAVRVCDAFNANRTPAQIARGTKMEFTAQ